ncbi:unnamed protein product [Closterium sp. NIES-65]|nr:unnamed protein product [Closterium sp. NIES-65]
MHLRRAPIAPLPAALQLCNQPKPLQRGILMDPWDGRGDCREGDCGDRAGEAARPAGCSMVSLSLTALRPSAFSIQQHGIAHLHPRERPETASQQQRICLCHLTPHTLLLTIYFHRAENQNPSAFSQLPPLLHFPLPPSSSPSVHIQLDLPNPSRPSPLVLSPTPPPPPLPRLSSHPLLSPSPFATSSSPLLLSPLLSPSPPSPTPLSHILPCSTPPSHENNTTLHTSAYLSTPLPLASPRQTKGPEGME